MSLVLQQLQEDFPSLKIVDQTMTYSTMNDEYDSDPTVLIVARKSVATQKVFDVVCSDPDPLLLEYLGRMFIFQEYIKIVIHKWLEYVAAYHLKKESISCLICSNDINGGVHICGCCGERVCPDCKVNYVRSLSSKLILDIHNDDLLVPCPFCNSRGTGEGFI